MTDVQTRLLCPFDLRVEPIARFLNTEFVGHPFYDGIEVQWFDDEVHGTGMLAFLSRRADRRVDYYLDPALRLDPANYQIAAGTGVWRTTEFAADRLEVSDHGVYADVRFTDVDGHVVEVSVDDRGRRRRRGADLLAPVGSAIDAPGSLLLVVLHGFDLVHRGRRAPRITIDGERVSTGRLPGAWLHRRHLIKAAAPLTVATLCRAQQGRLTAVQPGARGGPVLSDDGEAIAGVTARDGGCEAAFTLDPPLGALASLVEGRMTQGQWRVDVDGAAITGGVWRAHRTGDRVELDLDVTRPWKPAPGLPPLMRVVTRAMPVFRTWPTTYRWHATIHLDDDGARIDSQWQRTDPDRGSAYRRVTGS